MVRFTSGYRFPPKADHSSRDLLNVASLNGDPGEDAMNVIYPANIFIPCDDSYANPDFANAKAEIEIYEGDDNITDSCSFNMITPPTGYTYTFTDGLLTITALDGPVATNASAVISVTGPGGFIYQLEINITRLPQGSVDFDSGDLDSNTMELDGGKLSTKITKEGTGTNSLKQVNAGAAGNDSAGFNTATAVFKTGFAFGNMAASEVVFAYNTWTDTDDAKKRLSIAGIDPIQLSSSMKGESIFVEITLVVLAYYSGPINICSYVTKRLVILDSDGTIALNKDITGISDSDHSYYTILSDIPLVEITSDVTLLKIDVTPQGLIGAGFQRAFAKVEIIN